MRRRALGCLLLLAGCAAPPPAAQPAALESPRLVVVERLPSAGPDAPERVRLAFQTGNAPLDRLAVGWVPRWRTGAALVDDRGRLYEVAPDRPRRMLADRVVGPLASDGDRLAYTTEAAFLTDLHVHDGQRASTWARGLAGAGALRLDGEALLFVGGPPGAVVGLWEARAHDAPRCLSNCGLTTGEDFARAFVPPPGRAEDMTLTEHAVRWVDAEGRPHEASR